MDTEDVVNEDTEVVEEAVDNNEVVEEISAEQKSTEMEEQVIPEIEPVKAFTQDEVNEMIKSRVDRQTRRHKEELDKYSRLEAYTKSLYEAENLDDIISKIEAVYKENNIAIPEIQNYSADRDTLTLAKADAQEIISLGESEIAEAYKALRVIPEFKKTKREKIMEDILFETMQSAEKERDFISKGGEKEVLKDNKFNDFRSKFAKDTDLYEIYKMYQALNTEQEEIKPVKSLKSNKADEKRDFISKEEYMKLTEADFEKDPDLLKIIEKSMEQW